MTAPIRPGRPVPAAAADDPAQNPVKTYRYLRLAMPTLVVLLFAAISVEWSAAGRRCLQESISAYYFTPVQSVFVGALVAIGVCLVAIRGNTDTEDVLLNAAGMFAPLVAFVPTPEEGTCRSVPAPAFDTASNVANNVAALLVMGLVAVTVAALLARADPPAAGWRARSSIGLAAACLLLAVVALTFCLARADFVRLAHYAAAFPMFACIVGVVALNARGLGDRHVMAGRRRMPAYTNRYAVVAVLMVGSTVVMYGWRVLFGWDHAVLWIEGTLIVLFAVFWAMQTQELWNTATRSRSASTASER